MHINVALLSDLLQILIITLIYPLISFFAALTIIGVYAIGLEGTIKNRLLAIIPPLIFVNSTMWSEKVSFNGFWSMCLGEFLIIVFILFSVEYFKKPQFKSLAILILIESALILTYPAWSVTTILTFLFALILTRIPLKDKLKHFFTLCFGSCVLVFPFIINFIEFNFISNQGLSSNTWSFQSMSSPDFFALLIVFLGVTGVIINLLSKPNRLFLSFLLAVLTQIIIIYVGMNFFGFGRYWYYKLFYLLFYPLALFAYFPIERALSCLDTKLRLPKIGKNFRDNQVLYILIGLIIIGSVMFLNKGYLGILSKILLFVGIVLSIIGLLPLKLLYRQDRLKMTVIIVFLLLTLSPSIISINNKLNEINWDPNIFLAITPDRYALGEWVDVNLPKGDTVYIGSYRESLWFNAVSHRKLKTSIESWWDYSENWNETVIDFNNWYADSKTGDLAIILDTRRIGNLDLTKFRLIKKYGYDVVIIKK
jgi:hypothetical protein